MFAKLRLWLVGWILSMTLLSVGAVHAHWFYPPLRTGSADNRADEVVKTPLLFDLPVTLRLRLNEGFWVLPVKYSPHQHPLIKYRVG